MTQLWVEGGSAPLVGIAEQRDSPHRKPGRVLAGGRVDALSRALMPNTDDKQRLHFVGPAGRSGAHPIRTVGCAELIAQALIRGCISDASGFCEQRRNKGKE